MIDRSCPFPIPDFQKEVIVLSYFYRIDLHGHTRESAKKLLDFSMKNLAPDVREVEVVHGFHQGTALRELVRSYKHSRIERKILGLNQGSTIFVIKSK